MSGEIMVSPEMRAGNPPESPVVVPQESTGRHLKLPGNLNKALALTGSVLALAGANFAREAVFTPDTAYGAPAMECTTTTTTSPDGSTTTTETTCATNTDEPSSGSQPEDPGSTNPDRGGRNNNGNDNTSQPNRPDRGSRHNGPRLLEVPEKRTRRHWATKIINELRRGKKGRISATAQAKKDLYQARKGQCSKAEQKPSACPKLDKTLLKVLYKASKIKKFNIWHFTSGPHVPTSHHWDGDAADLRRFNGKAPRNKSMFPIIRRVTPKNKGLELRGPGDDAAHTGADDGHWHVGVY
ncbi:MAG TPA: hypothetical protein VFX79_02760 [Candidatus Saccharimonadales bacterium]|nr:hypothetical protein [Candidatus Saccharimonadales bacterium]